ncbi:MAG TPA: hypothetical protein VM261_15595 [Kofleriaceae bacterium]|nr:hypothetical protein [Kofleriaceae bacterium]
MRAVFILALGALAGACAGEEDDGPFRPGGGGGGGGGMTGGDARQADAVTVGDGGALLAGQVCVVTDLRVPRACPAVPEREAVAVAVRGTTAMTTSAANGGFALPVLDAQVTLVVATGSTTLVRSYVPTAVTGAAVDAPVVTQAAYDAVIGSLGTVVPDNNGTVVAYVRDGAAAAEGVAFAPIAGSSLAPFYDNGSATSWVQGGGTGVAGVALFVDVPVGSVTLDGVATDSRVAQVTVPVAADTVTFVNVTLADPP